MVKEIWNQAQVGNTSFVLARKLKEVKMAKKLAKVKGKSTNANSKCQ